MYLSKISLIADAGVRNGVRMPDLSEYGVHQELWRLFPPMPPGSRPFLYRKQEYSGKPYWLILSVAPPKAEDSFWVVQSKEFHPRVQAGERLRFALRANPTISRHDPSGKSRRHDVIMHAKHLERQNGGTTSGKSGLESRVALDWLRPRANAHGFSFRESEVQVHGYRRLIIRKQNVRPAITLGIVEFEGALEVTDPILLLRALQEGIGPGKGFGCGLLLIRRAVL